MQRPGYMRLMWKLNIIASLASAGSRRFRMRFECTYSLEVEIEGYPNLLLAPDGLIVVTMSWSPSAKCCSWSHDTAYFRLVDFDYQVYIRESEKSPDGKLFACWSSRPSLGSANWPTRLQVFSVLDGWNGSLTLIKHSPGARRSSVSRQKCNMSLWRLYICTLNHSNALPIVVFLFPPLSNAASALADRGTAIQVLGITKPVTRSSNQACPSVAPPI